MRARCGSACHSRHPAQLICVQYRAIRPVADGVRVHPKPMRDPQRHALDVFPAGSTDRSCPDRRCKAFSAAPRQPSAIRHQRCCGRSTGRPIRPASEARAIVGLPPISVDTDGKLVISIECAISTQRRGSPRHHAPSWCLARPAPARAWAFPNHVRRGRNPAGHQFLCAIDQHTTGRTGVTQNFTAGGIRRRGVMPPISRALRFAQPACPSTSGTPDSPAPPR